MNINLKYLALYSKRQLNAIAFLMLVRACEQNKTHKSAYSINALHELTGVHSKTIEKYILILGEIGLVFYDESKKIRFLSIKSKHKAHNIVIKIQIGEKALKTTQYALLSERFINRLRQIDYYRTALTRYHDKKNNPKSKMMLKEFKKLASWLRVHCKHDYRKHGFIDYGWAYKNIAKYLGVCVKTAVNIVSDIVRKGRIFKKNNFMFKRLSNNIQIEYIQHTFSFHGYSYKVFANTYAINTGTISL